MTAPVVLPDETYHRLVDDLLNARDELRVMELIGGVANVWPESTVTVPEREHCDRRIVATPELGDRVLQAATAPDKVACKTTEAFVASPLAWPPARPRAMQPGICNPPWGTPR